MKRKKSMKRRIIKGILALVRTIIGAVCGASMLGIPALLVHNGYNMTVWGLLLIDIPLAIPLSICLYIDWRAEKKAEQRRFDANMRRYEREKQKYPERYR